MKNFIKRLTCGVMAALMAVSFFGCGFLDGGENSSNSAPKSYTIQYTDDQGTHQLSVTEGMPYSMEVVPQKTGYDFLGLFDAEVGGTQYVSAAGASLAPYTQAQNMILFPQFKAKSYTVILDYQGAAVTGNRQFLVNYDMQIPQLPTNLLLEHKQFSGWYTEENCGGLQVADKYGVLPAASKVSEKNFDISNEDGYIYLYAGFEAQKYAVTFHFGEDIPSEQMEVAYNTPISEVVPNTRNADGFAVLSWSTTADGSQPFNGAITSNTTLYATEWAPCINFDSNGGEKVNSLVARAGTTVALPTATKALAKFMHWETAAGEQATLTAMPANSVTLKAVWQGKLVFDENGGTEVDDISLAANETLTLPTPEKEGYIFAGWYTTDKELYSSTKMPVNGVKLKAGWYRAKQATKIICAASSNISLYGRQTTIKISQDLTWDCSSYLSEDFVGEIQIQANLKYEYEYTSPVLHLNFYSKPKASDAYKLFSKTIKATFSSTYESFSFTENIKINGNKIYCGYYFDSSRVSHSTICDYYLSIIYPDTSYLYL